MNSQQVVGQAGQGRRLKVGDPLFNDQFLEHIKSTALLEIKLSREESPLYGGSVACAQL